MTRIFTEGFELQDDLFWTVDAGAASTSDKRSGAASYKIVSEGNCNRAIAAVSEFYLRFAYRTDTNRSFCTWSKGGTSLGYLYINDSTNKVEMWVGGNLVATCNLTMTNVWHLFELHVKIDDSVGVIELKVDGVIDTTFPGDTKPGADTTIDTVSFGCRYGGNIYLDDLALNDTAGSVDNSWCGDGKIIVILPNETAAHQLTGSDGNTVDNHLLVDEIPLDSDTTYVEGIVVDEEDLYEFAACGLSNVVIKRVWAEARVKDTVADGGKVALVTKAAGGTEVVGADVTLSTLYNIRVVGTDQRVNPVDSEAWEPADIDALQAGPRTRG